MTEIMIFMAKISRTVFTQFRTHSEIGLFKINQTLKKWSKYYGAS